MNARLKLLVLASLACAALTFAACGGDAQELQTADTTALVAAPAKLLAPEAPKPEPARRAFTPVVELAEGLELADESVEEKSEKYKYDIGITFPQLKGRVSPRAAKFNRAVRAFVAREVRGFKPTHDDSDEGGYRAEGEHWENVYNSLSGRYEVVHFADDLISVRFNLEAYGRGAGHAVQFYRVLNFDLKAGRALKLGDLFKPGAGHLQVIAANCITDLKRQDDEAHRREVERVTRLGKPASHAGVPGDPFIEDGAAAKADNYRAWNLTAEGVLVSFAACQVDSCAGGEKEVLVPFSVLEAILEEDGPAARLATRRMR